MIIISSSEDFDLRNHGESEDQYSMFSWLIPGIEEDIQNATGFSFDDLTPMNYIEGLYNKAPVAEKGLILFEGPMHRFDTYNYFGHSPGKLLEFLERYR